jgi:hypothetical protein
MIGIKEYNVKKFTLPNLKRVVLWKYPLRSLPNAYNLGELVFRIEFSFASDHEITGIIRFSLTGGCELKPERTKLQNL